MTSARTIPGSADGHVNATLYEYGFDFRVLIQLRIRSYSLGCYSKRAVDTLMTSYPLRGIEPCRWAFALPSCASELRLPPLRRKETAGDRGTPRFQSDRVKEEPRRARPTSVRSLTFCSPEPDEQSFCWQASRGSARDSIAQAQHPPKARIPSQKHEQQKNEARVREHCT